MASRIRPLIAPFVAAGILAAIGWLWLGPGAVRAAPDVTFSTLDGRNLSLPEMQGKPVLVTFWATTCSGCLAEMPHLVELYESYRDKGLEIVGVAMYYDPPNQVQALRAERQLPYPIALDADAVIAKAFGDVQLTPTSFLVDPNGKIALHRLGELDMDALERQISAML